MFPRSLRLLATVLCSFLIFGLCTSTAEARGATRVKGVARVGQDWQQAKLKIRWKSVRGASAYKMRVAASPKRMAAGHKVRTRATSTYTRPLNRSKTWYVQVRAIKKGTTDRWSRVKRVRFVRPAPSAPVYTPPKPSPTPTPAPNPTPAPPKLGTLFGFWAGADAVGKGSGARGNYDRVASYMGKPQVYRMFYPGSPGSNFVGSNADFGPPVVVSFKFKPQEVVTGKHDATMRAWFNSIPSGRQVWWSYFHEPENDIEKGAFTAAQYRAAWEHLTKLAPKRANLHPTLILMRYTLSIPTKRTVANYVTKGLEVLCWDSYLTGGLTMKQVIDDPAAVSAKFGLDYAIGEISSKDPKKLTQFVKDLIPAARAKGAKFVTWFETNKKGLGVNEADWRMRPHAEALSVWKRA